MIYPYNEIWLGYKMEWSTDTYYSMAVSRKPMKEARQEGHILYESIYTKYPELI